MASGPPNSKSKSIKNGRKLRSRKEGIKVGVLASIFLRFWSILEAKLGGKIEPRQVKTGQDRVRKGKERQDKEKGKKRQDLGRKRVESDLLGAMGWG